MTEQHTNQLNRVHRILRRLAASEEGRGDQDAAELLMYASRKVADILEVVGVRHRDAAVVPGLSPVNSAGSSATRREASRG